MIICLIRFEDLHPWYFSGLQIESDKLSSVAEPTRFDLDIKLANRKNFVPFGIISKDRPYNFVSGPSPKAVETFADPNETLRNLIISPELIITKVKPSRRSRRGKN